MMEHIMLIKSISDNLQSFRRHNGLKCYLWSIPPQLHLLLQMYILHNSLQQRRYYYRVSGEKIECLVDRCCSLLGSRLIGFCFVTTVRASVDERDY